MTDDLEIAEKYGLDYYPKRSKTHYRDLKIVQEELKKQLKDGHSKIKKSSTKSLQIKRHYIKV